MKRIIQGVVLTGVLMAGGAVNAQMADTKAKAGTAEYKGFAVPSDAKGLLERIHYINQSEIKEGELAQKNSMNADVKAFAEQMVTEHKSADAKVMALAKAQKLTLADMPKPANDTEKKAMAADKAAMEKLQSLRDSAFDGCYLSGQLGGHDAALGKLAAGKQGASSNAELSALLDELTQSVSKHRQHVYALLGKLSPEPSALGMGAMGETGSNARGGGTMGTGTPGTGTMNGGTGSDMKGSDMKGSDMKGSDMKGSDMKGSDMKGTMGTGTQTTPQPKK